MKSLSIRMLALIATIGLSSAANAIDDNYSATRSHYTIYYSGSQATMPFTVPSKVPNIGATVTSVDYEWTPYNNGNTSEIVELCYSPKYSSTIGYCSNISASQVDNSFAHTGFDAKGQFWIRHTIEGGSYPVYSYASDKITVNYSY